MIIPFDILYEGFCNRVRSSGKSDTILSLIKKENNDQFRIKALLEGEPDLYSLLERNISDSFERKDELQARKLWERGLEGKSSELLTEALCYCPLPPDWEDKVVPAFDQGRVKPLLERFMEHGMRENTSTDPVNDNLMARIMFDKGSILFSRRRFSSALRDLLRAWLLSYPKSLELSFQIAVCLYELGELDISKELLQCTAQHLRALDMSNEEKSVWTMNIVKVLKVVEITRKQNSQKKNQSGTSGGIYQLLSSSAASSSTGTGITSTFASLYSQESERIRGTSEALELKYSTEKGRHMVAKQKIPPGSTIIAETPYAWTMSKANYHKFCTWCLERIDAGIPCQICASAIFCDANCRHQAMTTFHGKECRILKLLDSSQKLGNMALLCFRTILTTPLRTVQEFTKLIQPDATIPQQVLLGLNDDDKLDSSSYLSVFSQTPNSEQRQGADLLKRTFSAVYLNLCLKYTGYYSDLPEFQTRGNEGAMSNLEVDIAAILLRHIQSASCNAYGINQIEQKGAHETEKNLQIDEIGGATYPIISTTNHNCNPNAYRINVPGRVCLVKTLREVQPGEEIFDSYGPLYLMEGRQERMSKLQAQYLFRCGCLPCTEDWAPYGKLRQQPLQFKCPSCQCAQGDEGSGRKHNGGKVKCPYCDKVTDMKKLKETLANQKDRFSLAKTSILAEAFQPFDKDMEGIICEYVGLCQGAYLDPCIESVEAQEVLKLFWNISIRNSSS